MTNFDILKNIIEEMNSNADSFGYYNCKKWCITSFESGLLSSKEKKELLSLLELRNLDSHGLSGEFTISTKVLDRLNYYNDLMKQTLGIKKDIKTITPEKGLKPSEVIKGLLERNQGKITIETINHKIYDVYLSKDGKGFITSALRNNQINFSIFDVVVDFLKSHKNKAIKGSCRGKIKLGDEKCNKDTVSGVIGYEYYHKKDGESVFDTVFVVATILDYAGLCDNIRKYLVLK